MLHAVAGALVFAIGAPAGADVPGAAARLAATARAALEERPRLVYGTVFSEDHLRDLPGSRNAWSLLETADPLAIVDRMDNGGLFTGEPALVGGPGSSWTQTSLRLGDVDVSDPDRGGTPLFYPTLDALEAVEVGSLLLPVETGAPGLALALVPRRPGSEWRATAQAHLLPSRYQAKSASSGPPTLTRFDSWREGELTAGGPLVAGRLRLLVSGSLARARRFERDDPTRLEGRAASLFSHWVFTPNLREELRLIGAVQGLDHPLAGRALFADRNQREKDRLLHLQSTWDRHGERAAWSLTGSYQRGTFEPQPGAPAAGTVERLRDGPVPELARDGAGRRERWELAARLEPALGGDRGRHAARLGAAIGQGRSSTRPAGPRGLVGELVNGVPARLWDYGYPPGGESRRNASVASAWAADRVSLGARGLVEGGLRFEATQGRARGADQGIRWQTLSPRLSARVRLTDFLGLTFFGGWGRYHHRLLLDALAFGDPAGPSGSASLWNDANGDRRPDPGEQGPLVARLGPGSPDGSLADIDPGLRPPRTDEVMLGLEGRPGGTLIIRFVAIHRRERDLIESVNVGAPRSSYAAFGVPDAAVDLIGHADDRILPLYDRDPASFGQDRYRLTNPPDHATLHEAFELTIETPPGRRAHLVVGARAYRSEGSTGYRGFQPRENDQGILGELFDQPNADTFARGRLFFDRNYVIKISGRYDAPGDVRLGAVARYQDGQPFARLVIASALRQGPEAVQAFSEGRSRFTFTLNVDARIEKGFRLGRRRLAAVLEAFNLLNTANEVEEDVVSGASFRTVTALQPPRALRVGLRADF